MEMGYLILANPVPRAMQNIQAMDMIDATKRCSKLSIVKCFNFGVNANKQPFKSTLIEVCSIVND